jgi:hypothetical protein
MPPVPAGRGSVIEARFADGVWHCGRLVELIKGSVVWGMRSRTGTGRRMCGWGIRTFRADRKRKREDRASAQVFDVRQDLLGLQQRRSTGGCIAGKCRTSARIVARPFRGPTAWLHPFITTQRRATATSALESVEGRNDHRFRISWCLENCRNVLAEWPGSPDPRCAGPHREAISRGRWGVCRVFHVNGSLKEYPNLCHCPDAQTPCRRHARLRRIYCAVPCGRSRMPRAQWSRILTSVSSSSAPSNPSVSMSIAPRARSAASSYTPTAFLPASVIM